MRVGLHQSRPLFGEVDQNVEEVFAALIPIRAELVVLPELMVSLDRNDTGVLLADIDPAQARDKAIRSLNDRFADRRPEYYGALLDADGS